MSDGDDDDAIADDGRELLAAFRAEERMPAELRARLWARIDRDTAPVEPARAAVSMRWAVAGLALAAGIAALWWSGVATERVDAAPPSSAAFGRHAEQGGDSSERGEASTRAPADARESSPADAPEMHAPAELRPIEAPKPANDGAKPHALPVEDSSPTSRDAGPRGQPPKRTEIDGLADETELLRAAQSALASGRAGHALALLDAGQRRFGDGALLEERRALRVLALCQLGRNDAARAAAESFAAAHPGSPLLPRVRSACADDSTKTP